MGNYKSKNHWNYRIVTKLITGKIAYDLSDARNNKIFPDERIFSVVEVYYTNDKPDSYIESKRILDGLESKKAIKWTLKKIKKAFKKPIFDLDSWPQKWKSVE